jgi:cytochrome c oxidase subunit II
MKCSKALFFVLTAMIIAPVAARAGRPQDAGVKEIQMTAKKYRFDPPLITVTQGEKVRLIITALDRDHGFKLDEYGINQKLEKGHPTTIEFTASKPGTFTFRCSVICGLGHPKMKGKLIVEEAK